MTFRSLNPDNLAAQEVAIKPRSAHCRTFANVKLQAVTWDLQAVAATSAAVELSVNFQAQPSVLLQLGAPSSSYLQLSSGTFGHSTLARLSSFVLRH